jgi:hypothetical protein
VRRSVLALLAVALLPFGQPPASARGGAGITLDVKIYKRSVDVVHAATGFGATYTVQFQVNGTISGPGYSTTINDEWVEVGGATTVARPPHREYPVLPDSTVVIEYSAVIFSAGVATGSCGGTVSRVAGGPTVSVAGC